MISVSLSGHVIRHTKRKAWDLNPHPREGARFSKPARLTISDYLPYSSGPPGNRTPIAWVQTRCLPFGPAARIFKRSVPELNRVFLLTEEVCCRNTYRPSSDPGWSRTITFLVVTQASLPLDHGIVFLVSDRGGI